MTRRFRPLRTLYLLGLAIFAGLTLGWLGVAPVVLTSIDAELK